jgi:putative hydrolase of the HAD superfamily
LEAAKFELLPRFKTMEGRLEWYCLDYWSEQLQLDIPALKAEIAGLIAVLPHVVEFLEAVRALGKRLTLVTNAHPKGLGLKLDRSCLGGFFDAIVNSHDVGLPKEQTEFWTRLDRIEPFQNEATVMVDDNLAVLRSAQRHGIRYPIAVRRPDSKRKSRDIDEFPAIEDFRELMPPLRNSG